MSTQQWQHCVRSAFKNAIDSSISTNLFITDIEYIDKAQYAAVPISDFAL